MSELIDWEEIDADLWDFYNTADGSNHSAGIEKMRAVFLRVLKAQHEKSVKDTLEKAILKIKVKYSGYMYGDAFITAKEIVLILKQLKRQIEE